MENTKNSRIWGVLLKVAIAVASALLGAIGGQEIGIG
jgi:hypothetical protein